MPSIFLIHNYSERPFAVGGKFSAARKARAFSIEKPKKIIEVTECVVGRMPPKQLYAAIFNNEKWASSTRKVVAFMSGFEIIGWGEESFESDE